MASVTERQICTNLWAYLHWLRATGRAGVDGPDELRRWREAEPERWAASIRAFAGLPGISARLLDRPDPHAKLVVRAGRTRQSWPADRLADGNLEGLPAEWSGLLAASHSPEALTGAAALLLLEADLRPDDCVLLAMAVLWPWAYALRAGAVLVDASRESEETLWQALAEENASIMVASEALLARNQPRRCSLRLWIDPVSGRITVFD